MLAIGIDLGGSSIKGGLLDKKGEFIAQCHEPTPATEGRDAVLNKIFLVVECLLSKDNDCSGIGVGTPGIIDQESGDIIGASPNIKNWVGTPLRSILAERYKTTVEVDNDVNSIAMGEFYFGDTQSEKDLACIAIGTGVGIGIILDKKLFRRSHEMGHTIVNLEGLKCGCGRSGCVESIVSARGLVTQYRALAAPADKIIKPETIFDEYKQKHPTAQQVVNDFIRTLASSIVNIVLAFSVTDFIISGGLSHSLPIFKEQLLEEVKKRSISHLNEKIKIKQGSIDDHAGILGAASLIFSKINK